MVGVRCNAITKAVDGMIATVTVSSMVSILAIPIGGNVHQDVQGDYYKMEIATRHARPQTANTMEGIVISVC